MEQEVQLEIDDAMAHLESLLTIMTYIQNNLLSDWSNLRKMAPVLCAPTWSDIVNLW